MTSEEISALRSSLATLIASGHLEDRMADRLSGFLITVCKAFCLDVPRVQVVANTVEVWLEVVWEEEDLKVSLCPKTDVAVWSSPLVAGPQAFVWTADNAEYVVGRGLEVRI